jgi:hypothetical protein
MLLVGRKKSYPNNILVSAGFFNRVSEKKTKSSQKSAAAREYMQCRRPPAGALSQNGISRWQ